MYKDKTFLAIIPARAGSKRLLGKNILDLKGKPLMAWSIEAGLKSRYINKVLVSSDDDEILQISKSFGAVSIKRPKELAGDTAATIDVICHVVQNEKKYDFVVLLQPTSPLRNEKHIDEAIELLIEKKADAVVSVCETDYSPLWCNKLPLDGSMQNFLRDEAKKLRSQELEKYYRLNGAIYICSTDKILKERTLFISNNIFAYKMDRLYSVDIDEKIDFEIAEFLMGKATSNV